MADIMHLAGNDSTITSASEIIQTSTPRSRPPVAYEEIEMGLHACSSPVESASTPRGDSRTTDNFTLSNPSILEIPDADGATETRNGTLDLGFKNWNENKEKTVMAPYDYIASAPGKEFRSLLLEGFNEYLQIPTEHLNVIQNVVRMLHTSSLLIDDIQDNSVLRRGLPVAHSIFGTAQTINSANYVYFLALNELKKLSNPKVTEIFVSELLCLHRGQAMDLFWRDTLTCPTEAEYLEMVSNKTGGLFRLAYRLILAESTSTVDLLPLVEVLGLIYQIADDYKNLCHREYSQTKGFAEDLSEGKFSFPVIHSINVAADGHQLLHILQQKPTSDEVKRYAVSCMERTGSLEYTKNTIGRLARWAQEFLLEADKVSENCPSLRQLLDRLAAV